MKSLTIFTPTYNRAHTIGRTYESLCRQTCNDFEWLIIDDGSIDNTRELVERWIAEDKIPIRYIYQENQGMHGAHNTAYANIDTELNTCIDSDDWMPDDAVERIVSFWREYGSDEYAGMVGLDAQSGGTIIGNAFPENLKHTTLRRYYEDLNGSGDKKLVYRTEVIKKYPPYPIFEGEHYVGLGSLYNMIGENYELLVTNDILVIVDYQPDGSSYNMWKQYWNNPKGFAYLRRINMIQTKSLKLKIRNCIHYISHSIRSRNCHFVSESPSKMLTLLCLLPGFLLFLLNYYKIRVGAKMLK